VTEADAVQPRRLQPGVATPAQQIVFGQKGMVHQRVLDPPRPPPGSDRRSPALLAGLKPDVEDGVGGLGVLGQPPPTGLLLEQLRARSNPGVAEIGALHEQLEWCPAVADPGDRDPQPCGGVGVEPVERVIGSSG
jgi:hypothetical protein